MKFIFKVNYQRMSSFDKCHSNKYFRWGLKCASNEILIIYSCIQFKVMKSKSQFYVNVLKMNPSSKLFKFMSKLKCHN